MLFHEMPSNLEKLMKVLKVLQNILSNSSLLFLISIFLSFTTTLSKKLSVTIFVSDRFTNNFSKSLLSSFTVILFLSHLIFRTNCFPLFFSK